MITRILYLYIIILIMKTESIFIQGLNKTITFYVGQNQNENFDVIDMGNQNDIWFHANNISSCHVVACIPEDINKKDIRYIIKMGANLCKNNTNKIKNAKKVEFIYAYIKNIEKTDILGCVNVNNKKTIVI